MPLISEDLLAIAHVYEDVFSRWLTAHKFHVRGRVPDEPGWWPDLMVKSPTGFFYVVDVKSPSAQYPHSWTINVGARNAQETVNAIVVCMDTDAPAGAIHTNDVSRERYASATPYHIIHRHELRSVLKVLP